MAKAGYQVEIDTEVRKRREQTELDTLVVYAVNDECQSSLESHNGPMGGLLANAISTPPGKYSHTTEHQMIRRFREPAVKHDA